MNRRHRLLACTGAALLLCATTLTAAADTTTVSVEVTQADGDTFTATFLSAYFNPIEVSAVGQNRSDGYVQMLAKDRRGTDAAWEVQYSVGDFMGENEGGVIPATSLTNQSAYIYDYNDGSFAAPDLYDPALQTFDAVTGVWSATGDQTGGYATQWNAGLVVPVDTVADTYTSILTLDITSAP